MTDLTAAQTRELAVELNKSARQPAEVFPPCLFILEEIMERDWRRSEFIAAMQGDDPEDWVPVACEFLLAQLKEVRIDPDTARRLGRAFGTSALSG